MYFLKGLDTILNVLYNTNMQFIICGDININYLLTTVKKDNYIPC